MLESITTVKRYCKTALKYAFIWKQVSKIAINLYAKDRFIEPNQSFTT